MKITSLIRTLKFPEPYKGKGILYQTEKIKIKEIKKTK
jgi:ribosomal protein L6P/L9E